MANLNIDKLKCERLKKELKKRGQSYRGTKKELISRLKKVLQSDYLPIEIDTIKKSKQKAMTSKNKCYFKLINMIREQEKQINFLKLSLSKMQKKINIINNDRSDKTLKN